MTPPKRRRHNGANTIPEDVQRPMRDRLMRLRIQLGISRSSLATLSPSAIIMREQKDLSPLKLGDLYGLASEYGYTLDDLVRYVVGQDVAPALTDSSRSSKRMASYMRGLSPAGQTLACEMVRALIEYEDTVNDDNATPREKTPSHIDGVLSDRSYRPATQIRGHLE